jgi:23S rRNA pseudouridine2605 synthase
MRDDPTIDHSPFSRSARRARKKLAPLVSRQRQPAPAGPSGENTAAPQRIAQRIAKVMARAGACSRRDAEGWIAEGRVALNGVVLTSPAVNVTGADEITIDGAPLAARAKTRLFLFHKPRGLVTTERDPEGRPTIFDYLREHWPDAPRLISVGRLDINTEGLLLLTNDGGLARTLELPSTGWVRRYRVRAKGAVDQAALDRLRDGVTVDGVDYAGIEAKLDRAQGANVWLTIGLREGKNREIKRVLEHLGLEVNRLIRLSFGPFQLAALVAGCLEEAPTRVLRDQLGPALGKAAGVDFSSLPGKQDSPAPSGAPRAKPNADATRGPRHRSARGSQHSFEPPRGEPRIEARKKPAPGPRKHVSVLRQDKAEQGARKKTLRGETADRSGRSVSIERLVPVERAPRRQATASRPGGSRDKMAPATRNARRFEAERKQHESGAEGFVRGPVRTQGDERAPTLRPRTWTSPDARGQKHFGERPAKAPGAKFADPDTGASSSAKDARGRVRPQGFAADARPSGPAHRLRGKNKRPGGHGGKPGGPPRGAGGPSKGGPRGKP